MSKRRMGGWQPLAAENTDTLTVPLTTAEPTPVQHVPIGQPIPNQQSITPHASDGNGRNVTSQPTTTAEPVQDPNLPRRRMAGWRPLAVIHAAPVAAPSAGATVESATTETPAAVHSSAATVEQITPAATQTASAAPAPVTEDLPRRRMDGWAPLQVGHPDTVVSVAEQPPVKTAAEPTPALVAPPEPRRRMSAAPTSVPQSTTAAIGKHEDQPAITTPDVVTARPAKPAAQQEAQKTAPKREMSKATKIVLTLLGVAVVAAGLVIIAQWLRTLDPVANFIATYDGTPTHPEGVEAGIPGWAGWQHFFNFFIMVMVIRSGFLIRNQERPEAYWTPKDGGFFSPNKKNAPQKVSIQQWIHQSFNVLWVVNGLVFYIMVFATGHWMRIVPTNWDIFPNIVSASVQYMSLDWPAESSWIYYNALQIMTYFITVFIAAPIAVLTGLRLSTWWPQKAQGINKVFTLPVARKIHFITMVYFILFIIVHLFLVFTTGVLTNMNMMFAARDASDWWGIGIFAVSIAVTVGVAWLIKPIFISPIAEKTGTVSTR